MATFSQDMQTIREDPYGQYVVEAICDSIEQIDSNVDTRIASVDAKINSRNLSLYTNKITGNQYKLSVVVS